MGSHISYAEVVRIGDRVYVLDAKDNLGKGAYDLGPVAMMAASEFSERFDKVVDTGNAKHLFNEPEEHGTFNEAELAALAVYMAYPGGGIPRQLDDCRPITARELMGDLDHEVVAAVRAERSIPYFPHLVEYEAGAA